jgi:hypothetical protein
MLFKGERGYAPLSLDNPHARCGQGPSLAVTTWMTCGPEKSVPTGEIGHRPSMRTGRDFAEKRARHYAAGRRGSAEKRGRSACCREKVAVRRTRAGPRAAGRRGYVKK